MLIEQIIEFHLRRPGPPGRTCTFIIAWFHDKTKIFKENLRVDYYLQLKYCWRQCSLTSFLGQTNHLQLKFNNKLQDVKRVLHLNCKLKEDWTI